VAFAEINNHSKEKMKTIISVSTIYHCTLEKAFKSPILCDIRKVHTGYGPVPKVTHCTDDEGWGKPGSSKKIIVDDTMFQKGGFASIDKVIERVENKYWKIEVGDFQSWMWGFEKFVGEWETTEIEKNKILIVYSYTLHSNSIVLYPLNWLFANLLWKTYMKRVMENIRQIIIHDEPYQFE
jgi:hypothetical protein